MIDIDQVARLVKEKYGRVEPDRFDTLEDLEEYCGMYGAFIVDNFPPWEEFGVTLAEIADNNMWSSIAIIYKVRKQ